MSWFKTNGFTLAIGITCQRVGGDRVLAFESVTPSDLLWPRDQAWWDGLRKGALPPDLSAIDVEIHPGENEGPDRLSGYIMQMTAGKQTYRRHFKPSTLKQTLLRPLEKLLKDDVLKADDEYESFLTTRPQDEHEQKQLAGAMTATPRSEPLQFEQASLADYMQNSEELPGPTSKQLAAEQRESKQMPLFVPQDVWNEGHELARLGGEDESAAIATGRLFCDSDSPEKFVVIDAFLQAEFADEEQFSVTFSGETWGKLNDRLRQRRKRLKRPNEIFVGSTHGHNFQPAADESGRRMCDACAVLEVCSRSTAVASTDDHAWHRAVFIGQPWTNLLIWGWNAREEEEWRMYGLENATLAARTVRLLKE